MTAPERATTPVVEDFPRLPLAYFRLVAGGPSKLRRLDALPVPLPDGRVVDVKLARVHNGFGEQTRVLCSCGRTTRQLHVVPIEPALVCVFCLRKIYRIGYRSQLEWNRRRAARRRMS